MEKEFIDKYIPDKIAHESGFTNRFNIHIGDWSEDGHGYTKSVTVYSNKTVDEVREAFIRVVREYKLCQRYDMEDNESFRWSGGLTFLEGYDEDTIDYHNFMILNSLGILHDEEESHIDNAEDLVEILMKLAQVELLDMDFRIAYGDCAGEIESFNGFWNRKLNWGFGYGLFF